MWGVYPSLLSHIKKIDMMYMIRIRGQKGGAGIVIPAPYVILDYIPIDCYDCSFRNNDYFIVLLDIGVLFVDLNNAA